MNLMAVTAPRSRTWSPGRVPNRFLLLGLALALAIGGAYAALGNPFARTQTTPTYQTAAASVGTVQVTVSASGPITTPASVPLSFPSSGKLTEVDVAVGQAVSAGQVLARVDTTELQIAVDQAQATLAQQQANLAKVTAGATPEAVAAAQAQVAAAQTTLNNAPQSLAATQTSVATTIASAQADISAAQVTLASAQKNLAQTQAQADAALQADQTALSNFQQAYGDQMLTFHANGDQLQPHRAQDKVAVRSTHTTRHDPTTPAPTPPNPH